MLIYSLAKIRAGNFHLELPTGLQDLQYAERFVWEPEDCLHLLLLDLEQTLSFSVERTSTAHVSAQLSVIYCFSALCSSKKEMEKGENSEVHHVTLHKTELKRNNTTKENWKGRN